MASGTTSVPPSSTEAASAHQSMNAAETVRHWFKWKQNKPGAEFSPKMMWWFGRVEANHSGSISFHRTSDVCCPRRSLVLMFVHRLNHHGGHAVRLTFRRNLWPGAAEGLNAEESFRILSEKIRPRHWRIPPSIRYLCFYFISIC